MEKGSDCISLVNQIIVHYGQSEVTEKEYDGGHDRDV